MKDVDKYSNRDNCSYENPVCCIFATKAQCFCMFFVFGVERCLMMESFHGTSLQEAAGSGRVESHVRIVPTLTCAWLAFQQKAPVKVRGTGVPSPGKEVPSPWQLHRAPATCLLGRPHMKREALCNPTGITPPNNAPLKERQKPCIKRRRGGARLWSPTTTNTDSSAASHLPERLPPFSICCLCPPFALSHLRDLAFYQHIPFHLHCGVGRDSRSLWSDRARRERVRRLLGACKGVCLSVCILSCKHTTLHSPDRQSRGANKEAPTPVCQALFAFSLEKEAVF